MFATIIIGAMLARPVPMENPEPAPYNREIEIAETKQSSLRVLKLK